MFDLNFDFQNDHIHIFDSRPNAKITLAHLDILSKFEHRYQIHFTIAGNNALDFQLSSHLGYLIAQNPDSVFQIVSQDNGFDMIVDYWQEKGYRVSRIQLAALKNPMNPSKETITNSKEAADGENAQPSLDYKSNLRKVAIHSLPSNLKLTSNVLNIIAKEDTYHGLKREITLQLQKHGALKTTKNFVTILDNARAQGLIK